MPGPTRSWTEEDLRRELPSARSWRQLSRALGFASSGGESFKAIKAEVEKLALSTEHFTGRGWNRGTGKGPDPEKRRAAVRRWYEANKDVYAERNIKRRRERAKVIRALKDNPCLDCGQTYPYFVMEFDHREGEKKEFDIANGVRDMVAIARLLAEIEKCDLVCSNCHRMRTAFRAGWDEQLPEGAEFVLVELAQDT
jgi:hypothetical protein